MDKLWRERTDPTGKRLFFQLLHKARELKGFDWILLESRTHLVGMIYVMSKNREDFTKADDLRDVWRCQNSGQEVIEE